MKGGGTTVDDVVWHEEGWPQRNGVYWALFSSCEKPVLVDYVIGGLYWRVLSAGCERVDDLIPLGEAVKWTDRVEPPGGWDG